MTTEMVTVAVHVPTAIEMVEGMVMLTPAPIPRGLLMVSEKLYVVAVDTVVERGVTDAAVRTLGDMETVAVLLLYELLLLLKSSEIVFEPEFIVEDANIPLVIFTAVPDDIVWEDDEVGKEIPFVMLVPVIPKEVTFVVTEIPR